MSTTHLITITECAARIGVSVHTVHAWIRSGRMVGVYTGEKMKRARYVTAEEAERVARSMCKKGGAK